jgi:putative membrane protein
VFLGLFIVCFAVCHEIIKRTAWLKRFFVSGKTIDSEVKEAAVNGFFKQGLYRTRRSTGVLVFVSVFEKRIRILADRGIDEKLEPAVWQGVVADVVKGIRDGRAADAICRAVAEIGRLLEAHFPIEPDDTDELKGLIVGD